MRKKSVHRKVHQYFRPASHLWRGLKKNLAALCNSSVLNGRRHSSSFLQHFDFPRFVVQLPFSRSSSPVPSQPIQRLSPSLFSKYTSSKTSQQLGSPSPRGHLRHVVQECWSSFNTGSHLHPARHAVIPSSICLFLPLTSAVPVSH